MGRFNFFKIGVVIGTLGVGVMSYGKDMLLNWKPVAGASSYEVQLSSDSTFKTETLQQITTATSARVDLPQGSYFFRVRKKDRTSGSFPWSRVVAFVVPAEPESAKPVSLVPPQWQSSPIQIVDEGRAVSFQWSTVEGAKSYNLKIYRQGEEARNRPLRNQHDIPQNEFSVPLDPGKYTAQVGAVAGGSQSEFASQDFQVILRNPNRFSRTEFFVGAALSEVNYDNYVVETATFVDPKTLVAGSILVKGNLWFNKPPWGLRVSSLLGGFNFNSNDVPYSDVQLALTARYTTDFEGSTMEFRPYFGLRAWTMPMVRPFPLSGDPTIRIFVPILVGPVLGAELIQPLTDTLSIEVDGQVSVPLTNSVLGSDNIGQVSADPVGATRIQAGVSYKLKPDVKVLAAYQFSADTLQWSAPNSDKSRVDLSSQSLLAGIQATDEPATDGGAPTSDITISAKYVYTPAFYSSYLNETKVDPEVSFQSTAAGKGDLEGVRWKRGSSNGLRLMTEWSGLAYGGTTYTYPEFEAEWGFRPLSYSSSFQIENFFGARVWGLPVIFAVATTSTRTVTPSLAGPVDTLFLKKKLNAKWYLNLMGELSSPLDALGKDSYITYVHWENMSYKGSLSVGYHLNPFFSLEVGGGYSWDEYRYNFNGGTDLTSSTAVISGATVSLAGSYVF